jgi:hypothetical protein
VTPEDRAVEEAERIERQFAKKLPHELRMQPTRGSDIVAVPGEGGDAAPDALGLGVDPIGLDSSAKFAGSKPFELHVRRHGPA